MPDAPRSPFAPTPWQPGTVVNERYRLEELMRRGGMGSVWRAEDLATKTAVAVKGLEPEIARDRVMVKRFLREAQAAIMLVSPNVVKIHDYGVDHDQAFMAMELLDGEPLSERIARAGGLPADEVLRFVSGILSAIERAHEVGIVHRDIKPDNVFICRGEPEVAKVLDFGVAKIKKGAMWGGTGTATQTGLMLGTPYYMSPEQMQAKPLDHRSDLWSIAVVVFESLLGRRPFVAETFGDLVIAVCTTPTPIPSRFGSVPDGFDEWFVRGTQRDPARRFQTAREMADELKAVLDSTRPRRSISARTPRIVPSLAPAMSARVSFRPEASPDGSELELTTGQRSVVTRPTAPVPRRGSNASLFALLAVGAVIVLGVLLFAFGGGARRVREAELSVAHAAVVPAAVLPEHGEQRIPTAAPSATAVPSGAPRFVAPLPR